MHINTLEVNTVHLALLIFTKMFRSKSFHVQMEKMVALTYLVKMAPPVRS